MVREAQLEGRAGGRLGIQGSQFSLLFIKSEFSGRKE